MLTMGSLKGKWKKNLISKAWERCQSFGAGTSNNKRSQLKASSSKSLPENYNDHDDNNNSSNNNNNNKKGQTIAPNGCFPVYVGPERQRFVVKTEFASHPLFRMLLEEAEMEYGFGSDGPIWLPCTVDFFYRVLAEMDAGQEETKNCNRRRSFTKAMGYSSHVLLSPARFLCYTNSSGDHGEYKVMDSEMLKMNHFQ